MGRHSSKNVRRNKGTLVFSVVLTGLVAVVVSVTAYSKLWPTGSQSNVTAAVTVGCVSGKPCDDDAGVKPSSKPQATISTLQCVDGVPNLRVTLSNNSTEKVLFMLEDNSTTDPVGQLKGGETKVFNFFLLKGKHDVVVSTQKDGELARVKIDTAAQQCVNVSADTV